MAVSDGGQALTLAHQRAQRALTGRVLDKLAAAWAEVEPTDDASWLRYVQRAEELCESAQTASANTALRYLERFRRSELHSLGLVADGFPVARPGLVVGGEFEAAVGAYGPAYVRRLVEGGMPLGEAKRLALSGQFGELTGLILRPGRAVVASGVDRDRRCLGWRRVCSGSACSFCAMLATRGAVYKADAFRGRGRRPGGWGLSSGGRGTTGGAAVHRSCQCQMEPVYSRQSQPADVVRRFEALWRESGGDRLQFRRLVEGRA